MKITKRQYQERKSKLEQSIKTVEANMEAIVCGLTPENITKETHHFNELSDCKRELHEQLEALETDYRRRNWTAADYNSFDLIANNID